MYRHILVPTDGSELSLKAAKVATGLAASLGARITALYVIEPLEPHWAGKIRAKGAQPFGALDYASFERERAGEALDRVAAVAAKAGVKCAKAIASDAQPWSAIVAAARSKKCDLIAMSSHGRRGLEGLLIGSQTAKVLTHAKVPVLVCR